MWNEEWTWLRDQSRIRVSSGQYFTSSNGSISTTVLLPGPLGANQPTEATELWTFVRPPNSTWMLSAIQQTS